MRALLRLSIIGLILAFPAYADTPATLDSLRSAAERGEVEAQYELGVLYEFGFHLPDHRSTALGWYTRAAEQGHAAASKRRDLLKAQLSAAEIEKASQRLPVPATTPSATAQP